MMPPPDQPTPRPILGFAAGTPLLTPNGPVPIEQLRPGDVIQGRPAGEVCGVFPTRQPIFLLHLSGQVIPTTADHPFFVVGQGWTAAADLHVGDRLRSHDGQAVAIEQISESQDAVLKMQPGVPPFPCTGLWPAGTLLETADGLKAIEDVKPGDYLVVPPPLDPERNVSFR